MGNTLTACTSGNKEDRIPKNNAPTERPSDISKEEVSKDGNNANEGTSFMKNVNIRKSLRAARKSVTKPFKKARSDDRNAAKDASGETAKDEVLPEAPNGEAKVADSPTIEVETHTAETGGVDGSTIQLTIDVASSDDVGNTKDEETGAEDAAAEGEPKDPAEIVAEVISEEAAVGAADDAAEGAAGSQEEETAEKKEDESKEEEEAKEEPKEETTNEVSNEDDSEKTEVDQDSPDGEEAKKAEKARITEALFNKYDKDGSGKLKRSEIKRLLKAEFNLDREEASIMPLLIDSDASEEVSLEEFEAFMDKEDNVNIVTDNKSYRLLAEALKIFKQHDADGSGKLTKEELGNLLQNDLGIPAEQAESVLIQHDTTGDEEMGFKEFVKFLPPTSHLLT